MIVFLWYSKKWGTTLPENDKEIGILQKVMSVYKCNSIAVTTLKYEKILISILIDAQNINYTSFQHKHKFMYPFAESELRSYSHTHT